MCPDLLQQWWQDTPESFFKGFVISHLNAMCVLTSAPQLVIIEEEDIMIVHHGHGLPSPQATCPGLTGPC